jgi:hypothetical protein
LLEKPLPVDDAEVVGEPETVPRTRDLEETVREDEINNEPSRLDPSMSPRQMEKLLDEVFAGLDEELDSIGADLGDEAVSTGSAAAPDSVVAATQQIGKLGDVPLRVMATCVGALIRSRGSLKDEDLIETFADHYKLEVPPNLRSLLMKFAWSAKGHHFVEFDGTTWMSGDTEPHEIANFGDWTFNAVFERAKELLPTKPEKEVYEQLLHEIYPTPSGRVPRIVTTTAGKAIWQALHQA